MVGQRLYDHGITLMMKDPDNHENDWMLFVDANSLNTTLNTQKRPSTNKSDENDEESGHNHHHHPLFPLQECLFIDRMNLVVGMKASAMSAFDRSSTYLRLGLKAINQLPNPWPNRESSASRTNIKQANQQHHQKGSGMLRKSTTSSIRNSQQQAVVTTDVYTLCLQLHQVAVNVELSLVNYELGYDLGEQLLANVRSQHDKLPTLLAFSYAMGKQNQHNEGKELPFLVQNDPEVSKTVEHWNMMEKLHEIGCIQQSRQCLHQERF